MTDFLISLGIPASVVAALKLATLGRMLLAAILGGAIGMERELSGKSAGLRTMLLICVGATLFTELSLRLATMGAEGGFRSDPARLAAQIIPGIGFIGAGAILHGRTRVKGLTTAATLWVVTAIGIAVGTRAYVEAVGSTVLVLFVLLLLRRFENWLGRTRTHRRYVAAVARGHDAFERLEQAVREGKLEVRIEGVDRVDDTVEITFHAIGRREEHDALFRRILEEGGAKRVHRA
ncbi:MAG TPA: MgtC/SapB family protein [Longimicrobium sp.]|nr:MgtC/SapB family protein [Longimicrobium sp.]